MRTELELTRHSAEDTTISDDVQESLGVDLKAYDELARTASEASDDVPEPPPRAEAEHQSRGADRRKESSSEKKADGAREALRDEDLDKALARKQQRSALMVKLLMGLLVIFAVASAGTFYWYQLEGKKIADLNFRLGEAIAQSQQLAQTSNSALAGDSSAFKSTRASRDRLAGELSALGSVSDIQSAPPAMNKALSALQQQWKGAGGSVDTILRNQQLLESARWTRNTVFKSGARMLESSRNVVNITLTGRLSARRVSIAGDLALLTQQISAGVGQFLTPNSGQFGQRGSLPKLLQSIEPVLAGNAANYKRAAVEVNKIRGELKSFQGPLNSLLTKASTLQVVEGAQRTLLSDMKTMQNLLTDTRKTIPQADSAREWMTYAAAGLALLAMFTALAVSRAYMRGSDARADEAERQKEIAEELQAEAKRMNDQNQAAILRLMNELQEVADGDLTVQATVSEDITGAIADSVNYTVEELRNLVARINSTAEMVNEASSKAQMTSSSLQAASEQQSREIKETGEAVLRMAQQINEVSARASESVEVAQNSLTASQGGSQAVNHAISGMNVIRDQIQETAKRIKRLGESSQEIGEIVELISDLTEQTNVLALNAAIQAASAGEAGRGFTIVAEEVQRLAERSAEATKQVAMLIKTIQTDTQDAVAAMERSTQGVVEGTRRSDEAGKSLDSIGAVSAELTTLIEGFSETTSRQAASAGTVAQSIQRILLVTEQTSKGTAQTAGSISQLSELAQELKNSVSRFKVA